jgi:hypothetical protein
MPPGALSNIMSTDRGLEEILSKRPSYHLTTQVPRKKRIQIHEMRVIFSRGIFHVLSRRNSAIEAEQNQNTWDTQNVWYILRK